MVMATAFFIVLVGAFIFERLLELRASRRNMALLISRGGREHASGHYPIIVAMHVLFFVALIAEWKVFGGTLADYWPIPFALLIAAQALRFFSRRALAGRWTSR